MFHSHSSKKCSGIHNMWPVDVYTVLAPYSSHLEPLVIVYLEVKVMGGE